MKQIEKNNQQKLKNFEQIKKTVFNHKINQKQIEEKIS